jgi:hypothetical protein
VQTRGRAAARPRDLLNLLDFIFLTVGTASKPETRIRRCRFTQTRNVEHIMAYHSDSEQHPVISKTEARQGVTGHNVRYVLGFGLAAVIIAFAIVFYVYFG